MIKVYTENNERKIKICSHNTFLFSPYVYKDKMSSNSFDEYLFFGENLRREHPSYLVPQFWEWSFECTFESLSSSFHCKNLRGGF